MKVKTKEDTTDNRRKFSRRSFLSLLPVGIFSAIAMALGITSKRFMEPSAAAKAIENWKTVAEVSELGGDLPIAKTILVESENGWSKTIDDATVYVLPKHDNKVLSSVCPHEGCPILWDAEKKNFACPCHDSFFEDDGKRISGPAKADLTEMETKVENGKLQVKI